MLSDSRFTINVDIFVPFHDCDPMGIVWHGNYLRYFEVAREQLLNQFNYGYRQMMESGYMWPVVDVKVKYRRSARFEQIVSVNARVVEYENRLKINYIIIDKTTGEKLTTGYTIQVAVDQQTNELQFVCPDVLLARMGIEK